MTKGEMAVSKTFSARFLAVVMMTAAGCYMAVRKIPIDPQFATLWGVVVTYYFGKSEKNGEPGSPLPTTTSTLKGEITSETKS